MTRLLLKYLIRLVMITLLIGIILYWFANKIWQDSVTTTVEAPNLAVFRALENRLAQAPVQNWPLILQALQPEKGSQISILSENQLNLSANQRKQLHAGKPVTLFTKTQYYFGYGLATSITYWQIGQTEKILTMTSMSMQSLAQNISGWMTHLMQLDLEQTPPTQWPEKIQEMQKIYNLPLTVIHQTGPAIPGEIVLGNPTRSANIEFVYVPLHVQDFVLKIGPIPYPIYPQYNRYLLAGMLILLAILALIIATVIFSRNLEKIYRVTAQYSQGDFTKPPAFSQHSSLRTLYDHITRMGDQLKQLFDNQRHLTRFVAHDCRTPIATMLFAVYNLEKADLPNTAKQEINSIKEDLAELSHLIDNFLSYERLNAQALSPEWQLISINTWLTDCLEKYKDSPQEITVLNQIPKDYLLNADPKLLRQALANLIDNAMKYGSTRIQISAQLDQNNLVIQIADNGTPIPKNDREKIFQPFIRLDNSPEKKSGFGLGLAIAQTIARIHHGEITVADTELGGCCFSVILSNQSL